MLPITIGPYRIIRKLGEGGMGVVYEAMNDAIERRVAIKVLHPDYSNDRETASRFFDEARAVNRIEHPSLVQISDYGQTPEGTAYLVMEFLRGESLAQRIHRAHAAGKRLDVSEVVRIAWQTADALRAAHEKHIVHRDMKPDNLMIVRDPIAPGGERVKILDFGIAKLMKSGAKRTATSAVIGTPLYMSPEQCRGAGEVDERSDVYSLGVVLYELLAGRCPFNAEGGGEVLGMHLFKEPPPLASFAPAAPTELVALTHRLLLKEKDARPQMAVVVSELARLGAKYPGALGPVASSDGKTTTVIPSHAFDITARPGRSSTLGRSVGERVVMGRSLRLWGAIGGGSLIVLCGALWFAFRKPALPAGPGHSRVASASSPTEHHPISPQDSKTDGGIGDANGMPTARSAEESQPPSSHPIAGASKDTKAVSSSQVTRTRPKAPPVQVRRKSAFSDVD